ncbi:TPR repeat-containing protein [Labilithrix luteola]|uniref:TPR repeat-containing protein n=1 Tax=Labilithrix luteola TaxID=1391654 RepID=A0A0K1PRD0_9BACT|nr:hypothetical protein [Labilithrix luteola]AKU96077.1 TPR repeat-containing protein [Labilithrix luteola]
MTSTKLRHVARALSTLVVASALASASLSSLGCSNKAKEEEAKKAAEAQAQAAKEAEQKATDAKKAEEEALNAKHAAEQKKLQSQFDANDRKSTYLKEKAGKATGNAKKNADAAVAELDKRRATASESIKNVQSATGAAWDTAKAKADEDVAAYGKAVESLEQTIATK